MPARQLQGAGQPRRGVGRPTKINDPARQIPIRDTQGQPTGETRVLTISESICEDVRTGASIISATRRVGITTATVYDWEHKGHNLRIRPPEDPITHQPRRLTADEHRLIQFSYDLDEARAEGELRPFGTVAAAALRPQITRRTTTVTEKNPAGEVTAIRETEVVEEKPPSFEAAKFMLERSHEHWMPRTATELTGAGGQPLVPTEAVADGIRDKLAMVRAALEAKGELVARARDIENGEEAEDDGEG